MLELIRTATFGAWLEDLRDRQAKLRIVARLTLLEQGHFGDAKPVGAGLIELRIHTGPGYRVYVTRRGSRVVVLLCGGDKSTQQKDIEKARQLAEDLED